MLITWTKSCDCSPYLFFIKKNRILLTSLCHMLFTKQIIDSTDVLVSEPVSVHKFTFVNFVQAQLHNPRLNFLLFCLTFFVCIDYRLVLCSLPEVDYC